ncbi:PepSY domain-containing protein [Hydrogenophaga sp. PAMC20947]|uniref:PepSY domain-containing protein n=1 Tax=Hydrogenophaga sp. PAMC20947 TaxID=2565558 RepID=UPI001FF90FF3|nr:PepSY domain-containing protein [Hydrogenophaga sp. PAMC20947]
MLKPAFIWRSEILQDNGAMNAAHSLSPRWTLGVLLAFVLLAGAPQAQAKERDDHERAQAAVVAGQVMPLDRLLQQVAREHPGQVLEVELEHDDGQWLYEIKLLQSDGQLVKIKVDARTGDVLSKRVRAASRH